MKVLTQKNIMNKLIAVYRGENAAYEFIESILKEHKYCKTIMKDQFNKTLIMTEKKRIFISTK